MVKKSVNKQKRIERKIERPIEGLKKYDDMKQYPREKKEELNTVKDKLVSIGKPAVPRLIEVLNNHDTWSCFFAADALGETGDRRAIAPLVDALEEEGLGENAYKALKRFGPACVPEVIKKVEYRIAHPIKKKMGTDLVTSYALSTIGEIRCEKSIGFLNELLDDYMSEMPDEDFDATEFDWKYRNVDFFHLLDCMVKQQDKRAIPHIQKARDRFPEEYVDYKICQIVIGRIKKGRPDEGYLPLEALEVMLPSGAIMAALTGGEYKWKDTFEEDYGEYFEDEE